MPVSEYVDEAATARSNKRPLSTASTRQMAHFAEIRGSDTFQQFDYGPEINIDKYGSGTPPLIDLKNIQDVNIALFIGAQDPYATLEGYNWLQ